MSEKKLFEVPGPITSETPFGEIPFWKWMDLQRTMDPLSICCSTGSIRRYLHSLGFDISVHRISEEHMSLLRSVTNHYSWRERNSKREET